jgi:hypothetical protein
MATRKRTRRSTGTTPQGRPQPGAANAGDGDNPRKNPSGPARAEDKAEDKARAGTAMRPGKRSAKKKASRAPARQAARRGAGGPANTGKKTAGSPSRGKKAIKKRERAGGTKRRV